MPSAAERKSAFEPKRSCSNSAGASDVACLGEIEGAVTDLAHHRRDDLTFDCAAQRVVSSAALARLTDDPCRFLRCESQAHRTERNDDLLTNGTLAVGDGALEQLHHARIGLHAPGAIVVVRTERDAGHEIGEHHLLDARFTE
jgi:hypothetical protein